MICIYDINILIKTSKIFKKKSYIGILRSLFKFIYCYDKCGSEGWHESDFFQTKLIFYVQKNNRHLKKIPNPCPGFA